LSNLFRSTDFPLILREIHDKLMIFEDLVRISLGLF
jgi:hypothetical protein